MNPNGAIEKRPRAWDISVRPAQKKKWPSREKKWPSREKKRAAFSAKQLVLLLRWFSSFRQLFSLHPPPKHTLGATKKSTYSSICRLKPLSKPDKYWRSAQSSYLEQ